ncbi:MAG TPA: acyl-CoA-binding protein [Puia sp.]|nr:acyl-CoA-binding protein [Puia sp.]
MATPDMKTVFEQAVEDSKGLSNRPSNDSLLHLYSLYKQATEGDASADAPANPFDFVAKAKYESWLALKGKSKEAAMQEYVGLIAKLKQ